MNAAANAPVARKLRCTNPRCETTNEYIREAAAMEIRLWKGGLEGFRKSNTNIVVIKRAQANGRARLHIGIAKK